MQSYSQGSELQLANLIAKVTALEQRLLDYEQRIALVTELDEWLANVRTRPLSHDAPPVNVNYLVGTANAILTSEIVVGTTPGGELGNTWASPTVDATHSGSAHHAQAHGPGQHTTGNAWKVVYQDAAGDEQEIAVGADGTVLTGQGTSAAPAFQAASEHTHANDHAESHNVASHNDTTATGTELETLTDGSDADSLHDHTQFASAAEAITAVEGESTLDLTGTVTVNPNTDVVATIGRAKVGYIGSMGDVAAFAHYDCDGATDYSIMQAADGATHINSKAATAIKFRTNNATGTQMLFQAGVLTLTDGQLNVDSTPSDDTATGITAELTAGTNLAWGDYCYIGTDGKMEKALATAESTSRVVAFCIDTISEDAAGTFLLQGFIRDDDGLEYTTIGAKVYLSDDTAGDADLTQPAGEDECIVILGIALATRVLYFNPTVQAIVEHVAP